MSEYFDNLNEEKEMRKHPSKYYSEEEKIIRGVYCRKCLESGNKVEIIHNTAVCPRCYCKEHNLMADFIRREVISTENKMVMREIGGIEIGKTYQVDDLIEKIGSMIIGHAVIDNEHLYFLGAKELNNGIRGKNITLLSLINTVDTNKGSDKEYIRDFILDKGTSEALGRLKVYDGNKNYRYVVTDIKEVRNSGYTGKSGNAISDINSVFDEMKIPFKADKHNKLIKIWRYA